MSYKYDHRQLAEEMEIYFFDDEIGPGLPVWLPNGMVIRDQLEGFIKELERRQGYERVASPHLASESLYARSGHLRCFHESMFPPMGDEDGRRKYYLRPMNCPHHHKVFSSSLRSYRQLPLRIAEYGQVYRHEPSGSLRGLARVRGLCQNDAHIYIAPEQAFEEISRVLQLHEECYRHLHLSGHRYRLSKGDRGRPGDFEGPHGDWNAAEGLLRRALVEQALPHYEADGEAAFYGPKIDVQMRLASSAEESIASVQLDFVSASRFDLSFAAADGSAKRPWIVHRAPLGSHERFVAMLLEYYDGRLPGWLAPIQLSLLPVSEREIPAARVLRDRLREDGLRVRVDESQGSLAKRLRLAHRARPFARAVIGAKEARSGRINVQYRDHEKSLALDEMSARLKQECAGPLSSDRDAANR